MIKCKNEENKEIQIFKNDIIEYLYKEFLPKEFNSIKINLTENCIIINNINDDYLIIYMILKKLYNEIEFKLLRGFDYLNVNVLSLEFYNKFIDEEYILEIEIIITNNNLKFIIRKQNEEEYDILHSNVQEIIIKKVDNQKLLYENINNGIDMLINHICKKVNVYFDSYKQDDKE